MMLTQTIKAGQAITGFWYKKNFYPIAGLITEIVKTEKKETAVILTVGTSNVITWLETVEVA